MKTLELPTKFYNNAEYDIEKFEDLGIDLPDDAINEGIMYVNPKQIVWYNEDSAGKVNLVLNDGGGDGHFIDMPFEEFLELIKNI